MLWTALLRPVTLASIPLRGLPPCPLRGRAHIYWPARTATSLGEQEHGSGAQSPRAGTALERAETSMRHPKSIVITGGSSGIGEALALAYAAPGAFLALTGRDRSRLDRKSTRLNSSH